MKRKRDIEYTIQSKLQTANTRNIASSNSSSHSSYIITNDGVLYVWGALKYPFVCTNPKHIGRAFLASPTKKCRNIESMDGVIACAFESGKVYGFGDNRYEEVGYLEEMKTLCDSPPITYRSWYSSPTLPKIIGISCGARHSASIDENGMVWTMGSNFNGKRGLSDPKYHRVSRPSMVKDLKNIIQISCGSDCTFALDNHGDVYSWGSNYWGQLGIGKVTTKRQWIDGETQELFTQTPTKIIFPSDVFIKNISASSTTSFAITDKGELYMWGFMTSGLIVGYVGINDHDTPQKIPNLENVRGVSCGWCHFMAVTDVGDVYTWGDNEYGQIGDGTRVNRNTPYLVPDIKAVSIYCGTKHSIIINKRGQLYGWGSNECGEVSNEFTDQMILKPKKIKAIKSFLSERNNPLIHQNTHPHHYYTLRCDLNKVFDKLMLVWIATRDEKSTFHTMHDVSSIIIVNILLLSNVESSLSW